MTRYDTIGRTYTTTRRTEPRIAAQINAAIGDARHIVNVGAGAGSYEPTDREVIAVEPSRTMLSQRARGAAPAVQAAAEALPFADNTFDAALASLTLHHWMDLERGLRELRRVARRQVVFFFEDDVASTFWLFARYFPDAIGAWRTAGIAELSRVLDVHEVDVVPVPADCVDGFAACFWNRPEAYLDPVVQAGISDLAKLEPVVRARGTEALRRDLASGAWDAEFGHLRSLTTMDFGYRLLRAGLP